MKNNSTSSIRTYDLEERLVDTFFIFFGYFNREDKANSHAGIFDYLPLLGIIPLLERAHIYFCHRNGNESKAAMAIGVILSALQILFALPRFVFAIAMFVLCLLPVCAIHGIIYLSENEADQTIDAPSLDALAQQADSETNSSLPTTPLLTDKPNPEYLSLSGARPFTFYAAAPETTSLPTQKNSTDTPPSLRKLF